MKTKKMINIIVIDDHPIFRKSLIASLKHAEGINIVEEADNGKDALTLIKEKKPDIALMDFHMPMGEAPDGLELIQRCKEINAKTKLIIITGEHNPYLLSLIINIGGDSLLLKSDAHQKEYLSEVIKRTFLGKRRLTRQEELNFEINKATGDREKIHRLNE